MADKLPFINSTGLVTKILDKIAEAQTPPRYTQDFQSTVLGYGSGSARPFIPLLKRIGFLNSDGSPTEIYKEFRNGELRGQAMAKALKIGYEPLFRANEYAYKLEKEKLRNLIIQVTGFDKHSSSITAISGTFEVLKSYASFDQASAPVANDDQPSAPQKATNPVPSISTENPSQKSRSMNLSYTINLNLPASKDPEVFNAIFKSLKENLLG